MSEVLHRMEQADYGFSEYEYAPDISASTAFTVLVECFVGEERAGGLGSIGSLYRTNNILGRYR